ncbi:MAG: GNAT family N-acetyltransferase [Pseudomonadota bacterium]
MANPIYSVVLATWHADHEALSKIRLTVFVHEQGVPPELELDEMDADTSLVVHAIARDGSGAAIGTGRLLLEQPMPRIGRMAVLRSWRGRGVGKAILEFLSAYAKDHGYQMARLYAQTHAASFYDKQGFVPHGAEFVEADIPHLEMRRKL